MTENTVPKERGQDEPVVEVVSLVREPVSDLELFAAIALLALLVVLGL
jgi:hypothetical protein